LEPRLITLVDPLRVRGGETVDGPAGADVYLLDAVHRGDREAQMTVREVGRCGRGQ
jgi:hypothetical protein